MSSAAELAPYEARATEAESRLDALEAAMSGAGGAGARAGCSCSVLSCWH